MTSESSCDPLLARAGAAKGPDQGDAPSAQDVAVDVATVHESGRDEREIMVGHAPAGAGAARRGSCSAPSLCRASALCAVAACVMLASPYLVGGPSPAAQGYFSRAFNSGASWWRSSGRTPAGEESWQGAGGAPGGDPGPLVQGLLAVVGPHVNMGNTTTTTTTSTDTMTTTATTTSTFTSSTSTTSTITMSTTTTSTWAEFYMYRAQPYRAPDKKDYPFENVNAANLRGVAWYLHHEVVYKCPWHHRIDRIRRVKVTMNGAGFAGFVAFDSGRCTVPGCKLKMRSEGYRVGCQPRTYPDYDDSNPGAWYSLPGKCPSERFNRKTPECMQSEPGGACDRASVIARNGTCTYHAEEAGYILIDDVPGVYGNFSNVTELCKAGGLSYDKETDRGVNDSFWDGFLDKERCDWRVEQFQRAFDKKYPHMPALMDGLPCHR